MKAILLDGSYAGDRTGERVRAALTRELRISGFEVEPTMLCDRKIGNCAGDFFCWIRSPGVCNVDDDNRAIASAIMASDLMVYLTPVTFGGYSWALKRMVDHQIQNISPFFVKMRGETHHLRRYWKYPDFLAVGWLAASDVQAERLFRHLAQRNAINFYSRSHVSGTILASQTDSELAALARQWLSDLRRRQSSPRLELDSPMTGAPVQGPSEVRRALLLVGSPRTRKSNSNSLGGYLFERLRRQGIHTETIYPHTVLGSSEKMKALHESLDAADLITLAFPLYVDSLPAPVILVLERIAAHRKGRTGRRPFFAAIANCGFPEAHHNATALAICATFARQAGFEWAGSLGLGGGEMLMGEPLAEDRPETLRVREALDLAADALARGQAIPERAQELMGKLFVPAWMYRLGGGFRWLRAAKTYGAVMSLARRPYPRGSAEHRAG